MLTVREVWTERICGRGSVDVSLMNLFLAFDCTKFHQSAVDTVDTVDTVDNKVTVWTVLTVWTV